MRYSVRRGAGYKARRKPATLGKAQPRIVPLTVHKLDERERAALLAIYHFSSTRRFRYGINEKYIPDPSALESLRKKGLAFYRKAHG